MLEGFEKFGKGKLIILWRNSCNNFLNTDLKKNKMQTSIEVINKQADINEIFKNVDCTLIPYEEQLHSPDYPLSAIESLMFGKPVVCSNIIEMSNMIEKEKCGVVCSPNPEEIAKALKECQKNYEELQKNCYKTFQKYFSYEENLKKVRQLIK